MAAGVAADATSVQFFVEIAFLDAAVNDVAEGGHCGTSRVILVDASLVLLARQVGHRSLREAVVVRAVPDKKAAPQVLLSSYAGLIMVEI